MNWNKGFSALYELKKVDPVSWMDAGSFDFISGTVTRNDEGLMQSADLDMTEDPGECWVRVYLKTNQEGGGARVALFTGLTSTPSRDLDGTRVSYPVEVYSVLKPVSDVLVPKGYYAPAGADGAQLVKELLSVGAAPVEVEEDSPTLVDAIVAEDKDSRLDVAWMILNAIGWRMRITGDGVVHVCPTATETSAVFDAFENDVVELSIKDSQDWFSVPNCIRVISGDKSTEYKDAEAIEERRQNRGGTGEIWMNDSSPTLGSDESIAEYALRKLNEAQAPARTAHYSRRFLPDVYPTDLVQIRLPGVKIDGTFKVTSQSIELGYGARTSEDAAYERT